MLTVDYRKPYFWHITCKDILTIICAAAVPIALGIYTAITYQQEQQRIEQIRQFNREQAIQTRQNTIYDRFLDNIYNLDKNGYLNESDGYPWAFANAFYRVAHRQWDTLHKADVLQFLKEKKLIGRNNCSSQCNSRTLHDIIRLNELNFDDVLLISQTGALNPLDLECVIFDQVSMTNARISHTNLNGTSFDHARLANSKFVNASFNCASFNGTDLQGVVIKDSDLQGTNFRGSNLQGADLSGSNLQGADLRNANLQGADLRGVNLQGADLSGANLQGADLRGANLTGADLSGANLYQAKFMYEQFNQATLTNTTLPNGTIIGIRTSTRTSSSTTTTISCAAGYLPAPSGLCVNVDTDFNNCGAFGYVCSTNYTECVDGKCAKPPTVQLANATIIFNSNRYLDDGTSKINLPLNITLYNYSTSNVTVTTNGVVCLGGCSKQYANTKLPNANFSGPTAFGFWDDLVITHNTSQNVYYSVVGLAPNRTTTFEFIASHLAGSNEYYHFQIIFFENLPNIVKYVYFEISDGGVTATIGVQESSNGTYITYSVNQKIVTPNLALKFDTNTGKFTIE